MPRRILAVLTLTLFASSAFAAGRDLAPRPLGPTAYAQQTPLVAYAGGRYLTVWLESLDDAGWRYLGAFSDGDGRRLSPSAFVVIPYGIAGPGQLIGTGDSFALFFPHDEGVQMMDVDPAGRVTATRIIPIREFRYDPSVAWNGSHFVAVERIDGGARAVFFDRAGAIARQVALPCRPVRHELLAVAADVFVAGVCDGGGLRVDRIASDGSIATTLLDPSFTHRGIGAVAAPAAGGGTLIAWSSPELQWSLKTAILSADGTAAAPRTVAQQGQGRPFEPLILTPTTSGFLLAYAEHSNLRVAKLDDAGALIETNPGPENSVGFAASAATDGTEILVADVHYESPRSRGNVRTRLVAAGAQIGAPEFLSIVPARQFPPVIGAGSGSLVAVWTEKQGVTSTVRAAHLAPDGTPLGNAVIDPDAALASDDLAWNGAEYLTVILRNDQLRARRINAFGERTGSATLLQGFPVGVTPRVSVVWAGDRWVVAGTDSVMAFHAEVASDGTQLSWSRLPLAGTLPDGTHRSGLYDVALAYDGERVLVAWIEGQTVPCPVTCIESRPAFITTVGPGAMELGQPQRIGDAWEHFESLSLATNGDAIVAIANRRYLQPFAAAFDAGLQPVAARLFDGVGDVTWDGSAFVLALRERSQLTVRRLDASLRDAARARVASIAPGDTGHSAPSVAVAISGNAVVGIQEADANSGGRAVAYAEQELGPEPQRRRTVRR